ncbi:MAG: AAA family ATPase, partial [Candidatus Promineifilaceae bacterium]
AWLETAAPLAELFGAELAAAVRLGQRRLELAYRRRQDERHIARFLHRQEQLAAFERLLAGDGGVWALHYLGVGGVGKTMLLRYLTARLGPERGLPAARIDFDYISPDYPVRRPGQLLLELAAELEGQGLDPSHFGAFAQAVAELHAEVPAEGLLAEPPPESRAGRRYAEVINVFAGILQTLGSPQKPVLLILDTCEELAKFRPEGARLPSLERTFASLERLQATVAGRANGAGLPFCVIFAGRRPLAQSGYAWRLKPGQAGGKRHLLPETKGYLALHELRGFDQAEAQAFLCQIAGVDLPSPAVYRAILRHSREAGRSADLEHDLERSRPRRYRYNPFDLALFAEWLRAEPGLEAARIAAGAADPYIELRILERLRQAELAQLLPGLALLGRFDQAILEPLLAAYGGGDPETFRELGDQEWVDYQRDEASETTYLQIDANLLPRLRRYYGAPPQPATERTPLLEAARRKLAPILSDLIGRPDWSALGGHHLEAALRVLPAAEAAQLWAEVERRIPQAKDWGWALRVLEPILGEEGPLAAAEGPLHAQAQATLAAALLHQQPDFDLRPVWA